jgi:copper resistance protein C
MPAPIFGCRETALLAPHLTSLLLAAPLVALVAPAASAHAILLRSTPAIGSSIPAGPVAMEMRYNSRIDAGRSRLTLIRADHTQTVLPILPDLAPDELRADTTLPAGAYVVRWQVLAVDGHITRGDVPFTVTAP